MWTYHGDRAQHLAARFNLHSPGPFTWHGLPLLLILLLAGSAWHPQRAAGFAKSVHTEILKNALSDKMNDDALALVEGYNWGVIGAGNQGNDIASGQVMPFLHFDSSKNPNDICDRWKEGVDGPLNTAARWADQFATWDAFTNTGDYEAQSRKEALENFGVSTHALEDFYSHSNWVEIADDNGTLNWNAATGSVPLAPLLGDTCNPTAFPTDQQTGDVVQTGYVSLSWWLFNWVHGHFAGAWCAPSGPPPGFKYCHDDIAKDENSGYGARPTAQKLVTDTAVLDTRFAWAEALATAATANAWATYTARATGVLNSDSRLTAKGVNASCIINKIANGGNDNCFSGAGSSESCWTGNWTDGGIVLNLTQSGETVTGTWDGDSDPMAFQGTLSGYVLTGTWYNGDRGGSLTYTMNSDCKQFTGTRWDCYMGTPPAGQGGSPQCSTGNFAPMSETYNPVAGSLVLPAGAFDSARPPGGSTSGTPPSPASEMQPPDWTVALQTSRGLIQLTPSGYTLIGSYDQGQGEIIAVAVDNVLKGAWFHAPTFMPPNDAGDLDFMLSADNMSFTGKWNNAADGVWHTDWKGSQTVVPSSPPAQVSIPWLPASTGTSGGIGPSTGGGPAGNVGGSGTNIGGDTAPATIGCIYCDGHSRWLLPGVNGMVNIGCMPALFQSGCGETQSQRSEPAGTLRNLVITQGGSDGGYNNYFVTVNGANSGIACNVYPPYPGGNSCSDTTHTAVIHAGDLVAVGIGDPGTIQNLGNFSVKWSLELDPTTGTSPALSVPPPTPSPSTSALPSASISPQPSPPASTSPSTLPASSSVGGCSQWNVTGTWQLTQSNGYSPTLNLQQNGTTITGTITYSASDQAKGNYVSSSGGLTGTLSGNQLQFTTAPFAKRDGTTSQGQYNGTVSAGQITNGTAVDLTNTFYKATWSATGPTPCAGASLMPSR